MCQCSGSEICISLTSGACHSVGRIFNGQWTAGPLKMGPIGYLATSVTVNLRCVASQNSEDIICRLPTALLYILAFYLSLFLAQNIRFV
jgi:hypothetical protein